MRLIYHHLLQVNIILCLWKNTFASNFCKKFCLFSVSSPIQQPSFPELQNLSNDELKNLRDDLDLQDKFIEALPQTVEMDKMIKTHMDKIEELASKLVWFCEYFSTVSLKSDKIILTIIYSFRNDITEDNLSKQKHLENIKKEILEKIDCINEMKNNYESLQSKYEKLCEVYAPQSILVCILT